MQRKYIFAYLFKFAYAQVILFSFLFLSFQIALKRHQSRVPRQTATSKTQSCQLLPDCLQNI